jgi:hypothetical protein
MKHTEELKVLQAKLESQRQGELLLLRKVKWLYGGFDSPQLK